MRALALALVGAFLAACILADPLPEQRLLPTRKPSILTAIEPSPSGTVIEIPQNFVVPIQLYNPSAGFAWRVFVDYDAIQNRPPVDGRPEAGRSDAPDVQIVRFTLTESAVPPDHCHTIEFVTALSFSSNHNGDEAGSDSVSWYYVPQGDYSKCASYDAGVPDAGGPDAGRDGGPDASP